MRKILLLIGLLISINLLAGWYIKVDDMDITVYKDGKYVERYNINNCNIIPYKDSIKLELREYTLRREFNVNDIDSVFNGVNHIDINDSYELFNILVK